MVYAGYLVIIKKVDFKSKTTKWFIFLCCFIVLYAQFSTEVAADRQALLTLFAQYLANYFIFVACVKTPYQFIFMIDIWLLGILHSSYHAIYQGGKLYDSIWLKDENHISLLVAMAIPIALVLYKECRSKQKKLFYLLCLVFYAVANVVAASRGGALAMVIAGLLCLLLSDHKIRNVSIIATAVLLVFLVFAYAPQLSERRSLFNRITTTVDQGTQEETVNDRLYLWGFAFEMFYDRPVLGVGPMNYPVNFFSYEKGQRYTEKGGGWRVAHSTPLQWLAEMGIVGSIIFLILQMALYKNWKIIYFIRRKKAALLPVKARDNLPIFDNMSHACMISQVAFWIGALFLTLLPYPFYWCLIPFSEAWKNIYVNYVDSTLVKVPSSKESS